MWVRIAWEMGEVVEVARGGEDCARDLGVVAMRLIPVSMRPGPVEASG